MVAVKNFSLRFFINTKIEEGPTFNNLFLPLALCDLSTVDTSPETPRLIGFNCNDGKC